VWEWLGELYIAGAGWREVLEAEWVDRRAVCGGPHTERQGRGCTELEIG